jgi:hypothetical protein
MAEIVFSLVIVPTVATHLNIEGVTKEQASGGQKRIDPVIIVANRPDCWSSHLMLLVHGSAPCDQEAAPKPRVLARFVLLLLFTITTSQKAFSEFGVGNLTTSIVDGPNRAATLPEFIY